MENPNKASRQAAAAQAALRKRVGEFVRNRREALGMTQGDLQRALGYRNMASINQVERGHEGVALKRAYAWADVLEVPRELFFRFIRGQVLRMDRDAEAEAPEEHLSGLETELLKFFRRLTPRFQKDLLQQAKELERRSRGLKHGPRR